MTPSPKPYTATKIFSTKNTSLYQCDTTETFTLNFFDHEINFRVCEFIAFKRKIQDIDILHLLASDTPDAELLQLPHCNRFFVLSILEILELKDLLGGAFAMLELNSLIHQRLVRKLA